MEHELEFNITNYCQAKCPSCTRTIMLEQDPESFDLTHMKFKDLVMVKENLSNVSTISLCGELGDPVMHPDIEKIINLFTDDGYHVMLHTNGGLRSKSFYRRMSKNKNLGISFGIDGMDSETNSKYRIGVDFKRAWENMNTWFQEIRQQNRPKHKTGEWQFLVFDFNKHQVLDVYNYAKQHNIPLSIKINRRPYGYVGDDEYQKIKDLINELP